MWLYQTKSHKHLDSGKFILQYILSRVSSDTWGLFLLLDQLFSELEHVQQKQENSKLSPLSEEGFSLNAHDMYY